jgi:hypothetical protein
MEICHLVLVQKMMKRVEVVRMMVLLARTVVAEAPTKETVEV